MDFLSANPILSNTIASIFCTLRPFLSLSFYTDGSLVYAASPEAQMGAAFVLTDPTDLNIRLAILTTTWPSAYRAELLAVLLALLVTSFNCIVNFYSNCESIIKHF